MDINAILNSQDGVNSAVNPPDIPVPVRAEEEPKERNLSDDEASKIIREYIKTGVIEHEYKSPNGLYIKFRVPSQMVLLEVVKEGDREILSNEENMTHDQAQIIRSINALASYIAQIGDDNYLEMQGDAYDTPEGYRGRKEAVSKRQGMNAFMVRWGLDQLTLFQERVAEAFDAESLKNS